MPFALDAVPLDLVSEGLKRPADPIFLFTVPCLLLPIAVSLTSFWSLLARGLPIWVVGVSYVVAALSALCCVAGQVMSLRDPALVLLVAPMLILSLCTFGAGAWLATQGEFRRDSRSGIVVMQSVSLPPLLFWLGLFLVPGEGQIGAYLGALTALACLAQVFLTAKPRRRQVLAVLIPSALIVPKIYVQALLQR